MLAVVSFSTFSNAEAQGNFSLKLWKVTPDENCTRSYEVLVDLKKNQGDPKAVYPLYLSLKFFSLGDDSASNAFIFEEKTQIDDGVNRVLFLSGVLLYNSYPRTVGMAKLPNQSYSPNNIYRLEIRLFGYDSVRIDSAVFISDPGEDHCNVGKPDSLAPISSSFGWNKVLALGKTPEYENTTVNACYLADKKLIKVLASNGEEVDNVWIYDMNGKVLVHADGKTLSLDQNVIPFEYQSGLYFVRAKLGNTVVTKKIITY